MKLKQDSVYLRIYVEQNQKCYWCKQSVSYAKITRDHILPLSKGHGIISFYENGVHRLLNVVLSCRDCNCQKGDKSLEEYEEYIKIKSPKKCVKEGSIWYTRLQSIKECKILIETQLRIIESRKPRLTWWQKLINKLKTILK